MLYKSKLAYRIYVILVANKELKIKWLLTFNQRRDQEYVDLDIHFSKRLHDTVFNSIRREPILCFLLSLSVKFLYIGHTA
jgi:hypothetical protein